MKKNRILHVLLIAGVIVAGVQFSLSTSQSKETVKQLHNHQSPTLDVEHQLNGNKLSLSLKVANFTFSLDHMGKENKHGEGHVHLYVDGQKVAKIFDNNFLYDKLTPGKHEVTVELAHNDHSSYGVKKVFWVEVK